MNTLEKVKMAAKLIDEGNGIIYSCRKAKVGTGTYYKLRNEATKVGILADKNPEQEMLNALRETKPQVKAPANFLISRVLACDLSDADKISLLNLVFKDV